MEVRKYLFLFLLSFLISTQPNCQTVDDIVKKHIIAMGGSKLDSLNTVIMEGSFQLQGFQLPLTRFITNNTAQRINVSYETNKGFIIATKTKGWNYFPFIGMTKPEPLAPEELENYLPSIDLQGEFYNYKLKGNYIEFAGLEEVDENICYKLIVTLPSTKKFTEYIDTTTNYLVKTITNGYIDAKTSVIEYRFGNYKKTPQGYVFPYALTIGPGKAFLTSIQVNPTIESSIYNPKQ